MAGGWGQYSAASKSSVIYRWEQCTKKTRRDWSNKRQEKGDKKHKISERVEFISRVYDKTAQDMKRSTAACIGPIRDDAALASFDRLPVEMVEMILAGSSTRKGSPFLEPRWHALVRAVCRLWHVILGTVPRHCAPRAFVTREGSSWQVPFSLVRDIDAFTDPARWRQAADEIRSVCDVDAIGVSLVAIDAMGQTAVDDAVDYAATTTACPMGRDATVRGFASVAANMGLDHAIDALSCHFSADERHEMRRQCLLGAAQCRRAPATERMAGAMDNDQFVQVLPCLWEEACGTEPWFSAIVNRHTWPRVPLAVPMTLVGLARLPTHFGHALLQWIVSMDIPQFAASIVGVDGTEFATVLCDVRARCMADNPHATQQEMHVIHHVARETSKGRACGYRTDTLADDAVILWLSLATNRTDLCAWALDRMARHPHFDLQHTLFDAIDYVLSQVAPTDDGIVALLVQRGFVPAHDHIEQTTFESMRVFSRTATEHPFDAAKAARVLGLILLHWPQRAMSEMTPKSVRKIGSLAVSQAVESDSHDYAARLAVAVDRLVD
ncbi:hypothetical protein psal_cds_1312 [Pandoravirus salinus]|uniref:Uncharacterized protein n=1 Tax=Pandoravirus salinus TaxID=1349410 RepID=S4VYC2_9VIRU|nr:hypothetical protein psal_cds_1312 [Pandoravirus salinus]AGO85689.1 hypothetical protein psal_cds_1312 [Pandoravirus salinus]